MQSQCPSTTPSTTWLRKSVIPATGTAAFTRSSSAATHQLYAPPPVPESAKSWTAQRDRWLAQLREKSFRGWPKKAPPLGVKRVFTAQQDGVELSAYDFTSQEEIRLRLFVAHRAGLEKADLAVLNVPDAAGWSEFLATYRGMFGKQLAGETLPPADETAAEQTRTMFKSFPWVTAYVAPRGIGPTAWNQSRKSQVQIRRRFLLVGQTLDGMRVWDVRRGCAALRTIPALRDVPLWLQGHRTAAGVALYASLFEPEIAQVHLHEMPTSHRGRPTLLGVLRFMDLPQAVAIAAERSRVRIYQSDDAGWKYPAAVAQRLGWDKKQFIVRPPAGDDRESSPAREQ
jgi:hypothetical protein